MTGEPGTSGVRTVSEEWLRSVDAAIKSLDNTASRLHDRIVAAEERWRSSADRFEALVREILEARQRATDDAPLAPSDSSCDE